MTHPPIRSIRLPIIGAIVALLALSVPSLRAKHAWQQRTPLTRPAVAAAEHAAPHPAMPRLGRANDGRRELGPLAMDVTAARSALGVSPVAQRPGVFPSPSGTKEPEVPFYAGYLKDPPSLGFSPDGMLFDQVYQMVKTEHVDRTPDSKLYGGVIKEVGRLLSADHLSPAPVEALPPDQASVDKILGMYGDKISKDLLWYAMIRGLLAGTDDPYTVLMTPKEYHMLMEQMQNESFGGVGIYIELDHDHGDALTVVEPLEGTPAFNAGLLPGDQIIKIDGKPTRGMTLDMATTQIRGPVGTQVVLTIHRPDAGADQDYAITRGQIEVASVSKKMLPNGIGYIRMRLFGARTGLELSQALAYLKQHHARSLIFDLRNNGGGYINAAIDVCSNFVPPGSLVTYVLDRRNVRQDYTSVSHPRVKLPMVLLVNQFSASASEITSGCLKDYHRAELMGIRTFGKGSVQQLYPLPSGAALKLTIAHFFTPRGHKINKLGVAPDVVVKMEPRFVGRGDKDVQLQKAEAYLESARAASR